MRDLAVDCNEKFDSLKSEVRNQNSALHAISNKISALEKKIDVKRPVLENLSESYDKDHYLHKEISQLKKEICCLRNENDSLKNFRVPKVARNVNLKLKIDRFEPSSHSENSMSPIESPRVRAKRHTEYSKHVREFRIDSLISHSVKPSEDFLGDPKVRDPLESSDNSVRTSKGAKARPKMNTNLLAFIDPSKMFSKNNSVILNESPECSVFGNRALIAPQNNKGFVFPTLKPAVSRLEMTNRRGSENPNMSFKNVRNFDDFQSALRDLKNSLTGSTYAAFNDNVDENLVQLEDLLNKYNSLDKKIHDLHSKSLSTSQIDLKSLSPVARFEMMQTLARNQKPALEASDKNSSAVQKELAILRGSSNLENYEKRLKEIQKNPSELDSFLYKIKRELSEREEHLSKLESQITFGAEIC